MSACGWCSKPTDGLAFHAECWEARNDAATRKGEHVMLEAHRAIEAAKRGERVHVSADCMERYGACVKHARGEK